MVYTHVLNRSGFGVRSPLDELPAPDDETVGLLEAPTRTTTAAKRALLPANTRGTLVHESEQAAEPAFPILPDLDPSVAVRVMDDDEAESERADSTQFDAVESHAARLAPPSCRGADLTVRVDAAPPPDSPDESWRDMVLELDFGDRHDR